MSQTIVPVLLGADLNCYNIARAFHMKYGVKSYAFARYAISATKYSRIVHFTCVPDIDTDSVMLDTLHRFADAHIGDRMVLFGCTDDYGLLPDLCGRVYSGRREAGSSILSDDERNRIPYIRWRCEHYAV